MTTSRKRTPPLLVAALAALVALTASLLAGCDALDSADVDDSTPDGRATSPLKNTDGTAPGLAPLTGDADLAAARKLIDGLAVKGRGPRTGYDRDEFGYAWMDTADGVPLARNGCDTRNDLLKRDGQEIEFRSGSDCVIVSLTLHDPYTGKDIAWKKQRATAVQIDHLVPLSYSWQLGAARWNESKREQLANDLMLAV